MTLATWQGPFPADVYGPHGKQRLEIGDTFEVGETELKSAHWKRYREPKAKHEKHDTAHDDASDGGTD